MTGRERVSHAAQAAYVAAVAGVVALVAIALFFAIGQPWGTVNDLALTVMTLALVPMMLGFYELGGRTPLWPARVALVSSAGAALAWSIVTVAMVVGLVQFDYDRGATGAFAISSALLLVIGAWLVGANLLAGPWQTAMLRWLGVVSGLGWILTGLGLLAGGTAHPLTALGGLGYQLLFPIWAYLLGRSLSRRADDPSAG